MAPSSLPAGRQVTWLGHMLYHLYVLENNQGKHYIGISADIVKRLEAHNSGRVRSTKSYRPWRIIYQEECGGRIEARRREKKLKANYAERMKIFDRIVK